LQRFFFFFFPIVVFDFLSSTAIPRAPASLSGSLATRLVREGDRLREGVADHREPRAGLREDALRVELDARARRGVDAARPEHEVRHRVVGPAHKARRHREHGGREVAGGRVERVVPADCDLQAGVGGGWGTDDDDV
jgi:hypothetical protein